MAAPEDTFAAFDALLNAADVTTSPWHAGDYMPDFELLHQLLAIPIGAGEATKSQGGRTVKALDAWIAHELRRAGFEPNEVWPRTVRPRVRPSDLADAENAQAVLATQLDAAEVKLAEAAAKDVARGRRAGPKQLTPRSLRVAINAVRDVLPGEANAYILGRFYAKQVDVVVSNWSAGPNVLVSTKSQFSSYNNNRNNRYEETIGEITNLKDRHPLAGTGYAFLVRGNIFGSTGAFAALRDLLVRLREPHGPYCATMMLQADWDDSTLDLEHVKDADQALTASQFFSDLIGCVLENTPVGVHREVRRRRGDDLTGGVLEETDAARLAEDDESEA